MSKIEDSIRKEEQTVRQKAENSAKAERARFAKKWSKWVKDESPRIAAFRKRMDKLFPCLQGDYVVNPRKTPGYLEGTFSAYVTVRGVDLQIEETRRDGYALFVPDDYRYRDSSCTWVSLNSNAVLKEQIKKFARERDQVEQKARDYYDRMPIGNTD